MFDDSGWIEGSSPHAGCQATVAPVGEANERADRG